ncbi:MAG: hypothetical protein ACLQAT_30300 [Candidatus Binataceae bacterium]
MIPAKQLLNEIVSSLRNVIAPAIVEPYPKAQAYMAAVVLEFVSRQVEERTDIAESKQAAIVAMFHDLSQLADADRIVGDGPATEAELCHLIERLYAQREHVGEEAFAAANHLVRRTLRQLLDQELKIAGKAEG